MNKEEEYHLSSCWKEGRSLTISAIFHLEEQLSKNQFDMEARVQLFGYYNAFEGHKLRHDGAEEKLLEHAYWLIEHKPDLKSHMGHILTTSAICFKPKNFARLREAWLEQVFENPLHGRVLGNAASFIAWYDFETACPLFERAYELQPAEGWLGISVIHCHSQLYNYPQIYENETCKLIIDVGMRSLATEEGGAPFLTCEYVSDAALLLEEFEIVRQCADYLRASGGVLEQMANGYLGLIALKENDSELAVRLMLTMKDDYEPVQTVFRLAKELFSLGERESILQLIKNFENKIKTETQKRWLNQIKNQEMPDFENYYR